MLTFLVGLLTVVLVLNCLFLGLLILIQLPKKEAGAGLAFGGAATDTLFGAGSGSALTKITKYSAGLFMGLSLLLSVLNAHRVSQTDLQRELEKKAAAAPPAAAATLTNTLTQSATTSATGGVQVAATNSAANNPPANPPAENSSAPPQP